MGWRKKPLEKTNAIDFFARYSMSSISLITNSLRNNTHTHTIALPGKFPLRSRNEIKYQSALITYARNFVSLMVDTHGVLCMREHTVAIHKIKQVVSNLYFIFLYILLRAFANFAKKVKTFVSLVRMAFLPRSVRLAASARPWWALLLGPIKMQLFAFGMSMSLSIWKCMRKLEIDCRKMLALK